MTEWAVLLGPCLFKGGVAMPARGVMICDGLSWGRLEGIIVFVKWNEKRGKTTQRKLWLDLEEKWQWERVQKLHHIQVHNNMTTHSIGSNMVWLMMRCMGGCQDSRSGIDRLSRESRYKIQSLLRHAAWTISTLKSEHNRDRIIPILLTHQHNHKVFYALINNENNLINGDPSSPPWDSFPEK